MTAELELEWSNISLGAGRYWSFERECANLLPLYKKVSPRKAFVRPSEASQGRGVYIVEFEGVF